MDTYDYPALYQSANEHSIKSQKRFFLTLGLQLSLLIIAASLSAINEPTKEVAYSQALILLASLGCSILLFARRYDRQWYAARAAAESIKTLSWRYAVKAEPFEQANSAASQLFAQKLKQIVEQNQEISRHFVRFLAGAQTTTRMRECREMSLIDRMQFYRANRIINQLHWYEEKATANNEASTKVFCLFVLANALAILFSILRLEYLKAGFWPTDVFLTLAAAVLTWMQTRRYSELATSYALTALEINLVDEQSHQITDEGAFAHFVSDAENAFSREHTQWTARQDH